MENLIKIIHEGLLELTDKVGAYGIGSWKYVNKVTFQCNHDNLVTWLEENNLEFNTTYHEKRAYECDNFILFSDKGF